MRVFELFQTVPEGVNDPHIFKAVFMAGAPGAGKSTIANKLFGGTGLKSLNVDTFWQLHSQTYNTAGRRDDYERFWELYKNQEKNFLDGRLGLLIDGTARNPEKMADVKTKLESMGYDCAMIFVNTSLEVALQRTVNRAGTPGKDQGRVVDDKFVTQTWQQVQNGLGKLQGTFGQQFYIIDNNQTPNINYVDKAMRAWLSQPPRRPAAIEWIKQQHAARTQGNTNG
jgi:adenylate kinase family enzyme